MQLPVDETTLAAWSSLLGLTDQQTVDTLADIETTLRSAFPYRPLALRHLTFEALIAEMDVDELALMYLATGLRHAGHPDAAHLVEMRGLVAQIHAARSAN
nr:hypothetical protein OH820_15075 [Streptomyces sp. NBC_00857]